MGSIDSLRKALDEFCMVKSSPEREEEKRIVFCASERKVGLCEDILGWAAGFSASYEFGELVRLAGEHALSSISGGVSDGCWVYSGSWGHSLNEGFGCNSRVHVLGSGDVVYTANYKWMPVSERRVFRDSKGMARGLSLKYVEGLHEHLVSGAVYDFLETRLGAD